MVGYVLMSSRNNLRQTHLRGFRLQTHTQGTWETLKISPAGLASWQGWACFGRGQGWALCGLGILKVCDLSRLKQVLGLLVTQQALAGPFRLCQLSASTVGQMEASISLLPSLWGLVGSYGKHSSRCILACPLGGWGLGGLSPMSSMAGVVRVRKWVACPGYPGLPVHLPEASASPALPG